MDQIGCADVLLVGGYYRYRTILSVLDDIPGPPSFWQTSNSDQASSDTQNRAQPHVLNSWWRCGVLKPGLPHVTPVACLKRSQHSARCHQ